MAERVIGVPVCSLCRHRSYSWTQSDLDYILGHFLDCKLTRTLNYYYLAVFGAVSFPSRAFPIVVAVTPLTDAIQRGQATFASLL